jgi:hypothetical protein
VTLAGAVAFLMLALLIGWVAIVLYATFRQLDGEATAARDRGRTGKGPAGG